MGGRGGSGKRGEESGLIKNILNKIDELPGVETIPGIDAEDYEATARANPIPMPDSDDYQTALEYWTGLDEIKGKLKEIPVNKLFTIQPTIDTEALKQKVAKGIDESVEGKGYAGKSIQVIQIGNKYIVVDGNHRSALAKLSGKKTIKAKVLKVE